MEYSSVIWTLEVLTFINVHKSLLQSATDDDALSNVHDLPMPAYGGHYSKLSSFLPPTTQPVILLSR